MDMHYRSDRTQVVPYSLLNVVGNSAPMVGVSEKMPQFPSAASKL
jgi:hypothetical protein